MPGVFRSKRSAMKAGWKGMDTMQKTSNVKRNVWIGMMGTAINPAITDLPTLMLFSVVPFNLFKHGVTSFITYLVYKRVGNTLRGMIGVTYGEAA